MNDLVASNIEVADCTQLNIVLHVGEPMMAAKLAKNVKGHLQCKSLVCPFCGAVY